MAANTEYNKEKAEQICELIETTTLGLKSICSMEGMPDRATFYRWLKEDKELCDRYTRAKENQMDLMADEILDIADDGSNDLMTIVRGEESYEQENKEITNRSKLRVEARKWLMSKLAPKKYGDKLDIKHEGELNVAVTGMRIE